MLLAVAPWRRAAADSFVATARPPASSDGFTIFDPLESRVPGLPPAVAAVVRRMLARERTQRVGQIAEAVNYLVTSADFVTGQTINVDGGRSVAL